MDEINEHEVNTKKTGVAQDGTVVQERTRSVGTQASPKSTVVNIIWYLYGLVAILLAIRFILKLSGANGSAGFVKMIYSVTDILSKPFDAIFGVSTASNGKFTSVFEPSILVAIVVYGLIAWGIVKLFDINKPRDTSAV
ncbi:MAG TPA: hypothetical protein VIJ68_04150 [Candidatus Saccharimonadales bacterium]